MSRLKKIQNFAARLAVGLKKESRAHGGWATQTGTKHLISKSYLMSPAQSLTLIVRLERAQQENVVQLVKLLVLSVQTGACVPLQQALCISEGQWSLKAKVGTHSPVGFKCALEVLWCSVCLERH